MNLTKTYPESLLELASKESIASGKVSLRQIRTKIKLLSKELNRQEQKKDQEADETVNPHGITRGAEYFERREA